jgi:site-specific DNA-methyltransferase (adenine-specific)
MTFAPFHIARMDALEWLQAMPSGSVDLIITDPPYESLEKHRAVGTTTRLKHSKASSNDWFTIFPNSSFPALFTQLCRVLKRDRHLYVFCDPETMFVVKPMGEAAGFRFWKPIVWDKLRIGMGYHYRSRYEFILFFEKGKRKLNDLGVADIIEVPRIHRGRSGGSADPPEQPPR